MSALRTASRLAASALFATAGAIPHAYAEDCDKNHYILDEPPCVRVAKEAAIGPPGAVTVDGDGIVYFSSPNIVFKMDRKGHLKRVAGNGSAGFAGDGGPALNALLSFPRQKYDDEFDDVDEGLKPEEQLVDGWLVGHLAVDRTGNLYISDAANFRVRKVSTDGLISTVAGNGRTGYLGLGSSGESEWEGDGRTATDAPVYLPTGVAVSEDGTMFVGSWYVGIRRITPQGHISTVAGRDCNTGPPTLCNPNGIALDSAGDFVVAEHACRVHKVRQDGNVSTIAGTLHPVYGVVQCGYSGDGGAAVEAVMRSAYGIAADQHGNLFIADTKNHCIRRVDSNGIIETFAGVCGRYRGGYSGDLGPATEARLRQPHGVAVDADGNVYIADTENFRIRKVSPDGIISTVAGNGADVITAANATPQ